ncbi:LOG family protein [Alkalibacillus aidingensis]|uniref:LOG family protein n=1 Tax=Alkalibacillus aidingensis TaxID=2747607 RepID=UPI001660B7F6|nr:TIGR00730 family Rossman fold protein [Alkalibacillus aidingensis]
MKRVAVYCGSREGKNPIYMEKARELGKCLAQEGIELVYGGAVVGLMGAVAKGVMDHNGVAIGVIPEKLKTVEVANHQLTALHVVKTMHERKAMMADMADAFIALPGGAGTLEELFEVITWAQIGYHQKPCALLNVNNYYTPLLSLFDHMIEQGFVDEQHKQLILHDHDPKTLIQGMLKTTPQSE